MLIKIINFEIWTCRSYFADFRKVVNTFSALDCQAPFLKGA